MSAVDPRARDCRFRRRNPAPAGLPLPDHRYRLGSAILPSTADAATVAGEPR